MKREALNRMVNSELEHVPRGELAQNLLRSAYNSARRHDIIVGMTMSDTLLRCIEILKKDHPYWQPNYDKNFFNLSLS